MPLISEEAFAKQQGATDLLAGGHPDGMTITRHEYTPPVREGGPPQSDMMGQGSDGPPTSGEMWRAAFDQENDVVNVARHMTRQRDFGPADPTHNPLDVIGGTAADQYRDSFLTSRNKAETLAIKERIEREIDNRRILEQSGWPGFGAMAVASILSPTTLLPFGPVYRGYRAGAAAGQTALRTGAMAGGAIAAQEAALHAAQETRTFTESMLAVGGGVVLGGLLGSGASLFASRRLAKASNLVDEDIATARSLAQGAPLGRFDAEAEGRVFDELSGRVANDPAAGPLADAGAAVTRPIQENKLASAFGLERAFRWTNPLSRLVGSENRAARDAATRIAEVPMMLEQNKRGIPTGPEGGSVESRIKVDGDLALYRMQDTLQKAFGEHRFQDPNAWFAQSRAWIDGNGPGKLSYADFKKEITKALRSETAAHGIQHPIAEVQKAAQVIRNDVFNYFRDEAKKLGLFPEDVDFLSGYVMRRYDVPKILAEHTKFRDILTDWLVKGQSKARGELARLENEVKAKQADSGADTAEIAKLRQDVEALKQRWAVDASQVDTYAGMWAHVQRSPKKPETLTDWVKRNGGIRDVGREVAHMLGSRKEAGRIIDNVRGANLDDITLRAWEAGFFGARQDRPTVREFLDLLDEDVRTGRAVRSTDEEALTDWDLAAEFRAELSDSGALTTTSADRARRLITHWLREQTAIERSVRADVLDDRAALADLEAKLRNAQTEEERIQLQAEIDNLRGQIGDVQAALAGMAERRTVSLRELEEIWSEARRRIDANQTVVVARDVTNAQLSVAERYIGALPPTSSVGAIETLRPAGGGDVEAVFRLIGGERLVVRAPLDVFNARALYDRVTGHVLLTGISRRQIGENLDTHVATGIYHEAVHAKWDSLDSAVRARLVAHAETLGILDMQLGTFLRVIGDPTWTGSNAAFSIRENYTKIYARGAFLQDRLDQEAVAHMQELAFARFFTDEELAPVLEDLANLRGEQGLSSDDIRQMFSDALAIPSSALNTPIALDEFLSAIRAFHGTPHTFEPEPGAPAGRFKASQIGTGEGAQAYGHGLYFAESEGVARSYRDSLSPTNGPPLSPEATAQLVLQNAGNDFSQARAVLAQMTTTATDSMRPMFQAAQSVLEKQAATGQPFASQGRLYEVRINAEPEQFLDWDKPLSAQSKSVRDAILPIAQSAAERELKRRAWNDTMNDRNLREMWGKEPAPRPPAPTADDLAFRMHGNEIASGNESALRDAGIAGIRYLDSVSRTPGEGTSNYVIFPGNEHLIEIVAVDGKPVAKAEAADFLLALRGASDATGLDDLGFYSKALEAARALRQAKGTPEQMRAQLRSAGVKEAELQAVGLDGFLEGKASVTRDEIVSHLEQSRVDVREVMYGANDQEFLDLQARGGELRQQIEDLRRSGRTRENAGLFRRGRTVEEMEVEWQAMNSRWLNMQAASPNTKWSSYSLDPSNPTYRETVLHLPDNSRTADQIAKDLGFGGWRHDLTPEQMAQIDAAQSGRKPTDVFRSGHWDEPNVIAHARTSIQKDAQGRKVFVVNELQSDWGQKLRDTGGARDEAKISALKKQIIEAQRLTEEAAKKPENAGVVWTELPEGKDWARLNAELLGAERTTTGHPLVNTTDQWVDTGLKRMIRQAVDADADQIAIPSGETVKAFGMGGEESGIKYAYDQMYPKNLRNLLRKFDKGAEGRRIDHLFGQRGEKLARSHGFTTFELTPKIKVAVLGEGQPLFALQGKGLDRPEVSTELWEAANNIAAKLKVDLPNVAAKSFDDQINELERFLRRVDSGAQRAGRAAANDIDKLRSELDELRFFAGADNKELESIANDTIAKITGSPAGRMVNPFDPVFLEGKSGPLQARTLKVPDQFISDKGHAFADFLDDDIERIAAAYVRSMAPDIALAREFGDINMKEALRQIQEDADRRSASVPDGARTKAIQDEARKAQKDLIAIAKRIRGTYNAGDDPSSWGPWTARRVKEANVLRLMGSVVISSIPDLTKLLMAHGFRNNIDLFSTFVTDLKGARISLEQAKEMSAGLELVMSRAGPLWDAFDDFGGYSKFDQTMQTATRKFGRLTLMDQWNSSLKQVSGAMTTSRILRASVDWADGKISAKQRAKLAKSGIGADVASEIAAQYRRHGGMHGRLWLANANQWDQTDLAKRAARALRAAVRREADITIVTPGQERPLWTSGTVGSVLAQFRTFQLVTIQRTLIPAVQEADAAVIVGIAGMIGLGMLSERLKQIVHGKDRSPETVGDWLYAGIANGGLLGWISDVDQTMHKATRGNVSAARLLFGSQRPISRFASQNVAGSLLGPSFGAGQDIVTAFGGAASGDLSQGDVRAMRRLMPYQNLFWLSRALRAGEQGAMDALGVPERRTMN